MVCRVKMERWRGWRQHIEMGGTGTEPQVNFSISLIPCDVHSLVKRDVQLDVKRNDSPSHMMQSDALSCQLT